MQCLVPPPLENTALEARIDWLRRLTPRDAVEAIVVALAAGVPELELWAAGALCQHAARAFGASARHFADTPQLIAALAQAPNCAAALVKGSRFMGMERVVRALVPQEAPHAH